MKEKKSYLLRGTPMSLLVLGAGFVMASSANIKASLGMGLAVFVTMLLSSVTICAVRKFIPHAIRLPAYVLIITGYVSLIDMLMQAYFPETVEMLGVHLAALAVSAVMFRDAEEVAGIKDEIQTIVTSVVSGFLFVIVLAVCAVIREFFGSASIFGKEIAFMKDYRISALAGVVGGYIVLAIVVAVINKLTQKKTTEEDKE